MTSRELTDDDLIGHIRRLGREDLAETCEARLGPAPDGTTSWMSLSPTRMAEDLVKRLSQRELRQLAAQGAAKQRAPSVGGPSWSHDASQRLCAELASRALAPLSERLSARWRDVEAHLDVPELLDGVVYLRYTQDTWQPSGNDLVLTQERRQALILLDYNDQVTTVSARSEKEALFIGASWAYVVGATPDAMELTFPPSIKDDLLSPPAIQMLEAAYGRLGSIGRIVNVDRIWTRPQDPGAQVDEQRASGEAKHVLLHEDVHRQLRRGDHITGLAFQLEYLYKPRGREQRYVPHVTLSSTNGPLVVKVTQRGHSIELASYVYQELRRALGRETPSDRLNEVNCVIDGIKG
jgi:hypothetical protein